MQDRSFGCVYSDLLSRSVFLVATSIHPSPVMSSETHQITTSIRRRLADLQTYQLPRLRECMGPIDLQRELSAELKEDIRRIKRSLDVCAVRYNSTLKLMRASYRNWTRWHTNSRRRRRGLS